MKKLFLIWVLFFTSFFLHAQVSFVSVVDEDSHSKKEDFYHTFEYYIIPEKGQATKCQATRVGRKWFATAAHCVITACADKCTLRLDLLEESTSVFLDVTHTKKKEHVFIHPKYNPKVPASYDFALLKIDPVSAYKSYYRRPTKDKKGQNVWISRQAFDNFLSKNSSARYAYKEVLSPSLPPLLVFEDSTRKVDRKLSVISIFDGKRVILKNPNPTYYVKELGFAYTDSFGVKKGMSGSGVMTNTGELAGIISGHLGISNKEMEKEKQFFMFTAFNKSLMEFMEQTMNSDYYKMERKSASPNYVLRTTKNHQQIINIVRLLSQGNDTIFVP
ncbi:MAG: trypsin-like serine protease [Elusimicrobiaceae bacterium]|nr:trypsin-like serine protease [Elusimicrobiaceae bacterium]